MDASGNSCGDECAATVTITDDDTAGVLVSKPALTVTEEDTTGETYTVVLDSQPTANVTITVGGFTGSDVTASPASLPFTNMNWSTPQVVTVTATGDTDTVTDMVSLTHSAASTDTDYNGITIAGVMVTVNDNDTTNNAPTFSSSTANRSVAESTAPNQNVGGVLTATDADMDTLTYTLEGTDAGSFDLATVSGSAQIRTRTGVTYNHEVKSSYTVVVKAADGNGGTDTITVTITITDVNEAPAQPAAPSVSTPTGSSTRLNVSWIPPTDTGPEITSYDLQYRQGTSGSFTNGPQDVTSTSGAIQSLTPNTSYEVRVRATNDEGDSQWSLSGNGRTGATTPDKPTNLMAIASGQTQIDLDWTAPTNNGGSPITGYKIEWSPNGSSNWNVLEINTGNTNTDYSDTDLSGGETRYYRVSAINSVGTGTASNVANANIGAVPGAPTNLTATARGTDRIDLSWRAPTNRGTSAITGYRTEVSAHGAPGGYDAWTAIVESTRSTSYSHTGLKAATTYHHRVSAINASGRGQSSQTANATTNVDTRQQPGVFESFRIVDAGQNNQANYDTDRLINVSSAPLVITRGTMNVINPKLFDDYPDNGTDEEKRNYLQSVKPGIAIEVDPNLGIDEIESNIAYNYPDYPIKGDVTVLFTDTGSRTYYGACATDSTNAPGYANRSNNWEKLNYGACDMLRYNGTVTMVIRAYTGGKLVESTTLKFTVLNWLQR